MNGLYSFLLSGWDKIVTHLLICSIFLKNKITLDGIQLSLFHHHHAIQVNQTFPLFFQIHLLHQLDSLFSGFKRFRIKDADTVYLQFGLIKVLFSKAASALRKFSCAFFSPPSSQPASNKANNATNPIFSCT